MSAAPLRRFAQSHVAWCLPAVAFYAYVLWRVSFDAPIWDDYDTMLASVMALRDAPSLRAWLGVLLDQHNEHRIAVMRLASLAASWVGPIDFRAFMVVGNLLVLGIFVLAWREYRERLAAPIAGAGAFLLLQWSYNEATLMASAVLPNVGVVFFSLACIYFAMRGGVAAAAASLLFGVLAAGSQANGLMALPLATAAALYMRRWPRAALFTAAALAVAILYFWTYRKPPLHPSMLVALDRPVDAGALFLVNLGGVAPGLKGAAVAGALLVLAMVWLLLKGAWRSHPTAILWMVFLLVSLAAATAGRVGFGLIHAPRYAVYSSCVLLIVFFAAWEMTAPWRRELVLGAFFAAGAFSAAVSWLAAPEVARQSVKGRVLAEVSPPMPQAPFRYAGMQYPDLNRAAMVLAQAGERGLYWPRKRELQPATVVAAAAPPPIARTFGRIDKVEVSGARVLLDGWSDFTATHRDRRFTVYPVDGVVSARPVVVPRQDIAFAYGDAELVFSGFRLELDFESPAAAQQAARNACVAVSAAGGAATLLSSDSARPCAQR